MDFFFGCIVGSIITAFALSLCRAASDRDLPDIEIEEPDDEEIGNFGEEWFNE